MLHLYVQAPFAVCRTFSAGWYRSTATFITPSAVYGLLMNIAGIETRLREEDHQQNVPASRMRPGLPAGRIAMGIPARGKTKPVPPTVQTLYQQLHNYPVGASAGMPKELSKGNKNNITPVRRELLMNLQALIACEFESDVEQRIQRGLRGELNESRYGLPFVGDNQLLLDRLELRNVEDAGSAHWYEQLSPEPGASPRPHTTQLTVWIDRADMSRTISHLYAPSQLATTQIPEDAWTIISPP